MLVLSRKLSQQIMIGSDITITITRIERNLVRLGIDAPAGVPILRQEVAARRAPDRVTPAIETSRQKASAC